MTSHIVTDALKNYSLEDSQQTEEEKKKLINFGSSPERVLINKFRSVCFLIKQH